MGDKMIETDRLLELAPELKDIFDEAATRTGDEAKGISRQEEEAAVLLKQRIEKTLDRLGQNARGLANSDREWLLSSASDGARDIAIRELNIRLSH